VRYAFTVISALALWGTVACGKANAEKFSAADSLKLVERADRLAARLSDSASGAGRAAPIGRWLLPAPLNEVSGITLTSDGRLVAHGDEYGRISVMDPRRGVLLKEFSIGAKADFEGITYTSGTFYMVASNGQIYSFREGNAGQRVTYSLLDTRLGKECEFEGITFDHRRNALLLPCKNVERPELRDNVVIYVYSLNPTSAQRITHIAIPIENVIGENGWTTFRPTDIAIDPHSGHYVLVAAQERGLLEIEPNGSVIHSMSLPGGEDEHPQAEGVAIAEDGILFVSDEAAGRRASITLYRWPLEPAAQTQP
jgi:uncharacterized protein YjiK